jgi:hypothetical protein
MSEANERPDSRAPAVRTVIAEPCVRASALPCSRWSFAGWMAAGRLSYMSSSMAWSFLLDSSSWLMVSASTPHLVNASVAKNVCVQVLHPSCLALRTDGAERTVLRFWRRTTRL